MYWSDLVRAAGDLLYLAAAIITLATAHAGRHHTDDNTDHD